MALSVDDMRRRFPTPSANFKVEINGEVVAFTEVSGLSRELNTITYRESKTVQPGGGPEVLYMPGPRKPVHFSLHKGIIRTVSLPAFYSWINSTQGNVVEKKDISIRLTDEDGNPTFSWKVINAFPVGLIAPHFDANATEVAIERLDLVADTFIMEEN